MKDTHITNVKVDGLAIKICARKTSNGHCFVFKAKGTERTTQIPKAYYDQAIKYKSQWASLLQRFFSVSKKEFVADCKGFAWLASYVGKKTHIRGTRAKNLKKYTKALYGVLAQI